MTCKTNTTSNRHGEKGAALVISILIATLLLAVAGTVILTSGMSATTSRRAGSKRR
jgi:flagellar basal body-associated protein FliL